MDPGPDNVEDSVIFYLNLGYQEIERIKKP